MTQTAGGAGAAMPETALTRLLGLRLPVLGAAMGGIAGPALAAAISEAGGAGSVGLFRLKPAQAAEQVRETAARTQRPFGIGVVAEIHRPGELQAQLDAALAVSPSAAFVQSYGLLPPPLVQMVRARGRRLLVQVGHAADARQALALGVDALILQGTEAGGHLLGREPLLRVHAEVAALKPEVPVLAAGGIGDGADIYRSLRHGFAGALCGTLFVCASEANAHPHYQARICGAQAGDTRISSAFEIGWPGRPHRVLDTATARTRCGEWPVEPIASTCQGARRMPLWRYSVAVPTREVEGDIEAMAMYCGEGCGPIREVMPAAALLARLVLQYAEAASAAAGC